MRTIDQEYAFQPRSLDKYPSRCGHSDGYVEERAGGEEHLESSGHVDLASRILTAES